jgi:Reverse transcriptase (RNA-dependent DNA polymerase)
MSRTFSRRPIRENREIHHRRVVGTSRSAPGGAYALCSEKKNGTLRTVFDLREQNGNTVKDVTPFPDHRNDITRAAYRTKLNMSEAYEQIRVDPAHVSKIAFATILGTFRSQVMQMGDCNELSMFQYLMTVIFCDWISRFVHVYMNDIFIFSCSIEEHEKHLGIVFGGLRKNHRFLSKKRHTSTPRGWSA